MPFRTLLASLGLSLLCLSAPALHAPQGCGGCRGNGGSGTASGGSCGGVVSISVTIEKGTCKWITEEDDGIPACRQVQGCLPIVTRTWAGLPPELPLDFCVELMPEGLMCLSPQPTSKTGAGIDPSRASARMPCENGATRTFLIRAPDCGLEAAAQATCSSCSGV